MSEQGRGGLPSIRERLSQGLVVISFAWALSVAAVVWLAVHSQVEKLLDNTLQESAEILFGLLSSNAARLPLDSGGSFDAPPHEEHLVWQIVGPGPRVLMRSHRAPAEPLAPAASLGFSSAGADWRVFGMPFDGNGRVLQVAQRGAEREAACDQAAGLCAGLALIVGLACAFWLRSRVRRELVPIEALSGAVAGFDPLHAGAALPDATRAELVPMRDAIHDLARRLANRIAGERAFSGHAAHALRTPLAGMVAQLAVAQRKSPPEAQPHLQRTREAADRLHQVVTALLAMFRTGGEPAWTDVDVKALLADLPCEGLLLEIDGAPTIPADPDLLAAALLNLLDNAVRHGARRVGVSCRVDAQGAGVLVRDDGPGVAASVREGLQAALDTQRYEGRTGFGLMLADLVARAHGGRLVLTGEAGAAGFAADLRLGPRPVAP